VCRTKDKKKGKNKEVVAEIVKKCKCKTKGQTKQSDGSDGVEKKTVDWLKKRSIFFKLPYGEHNRLRHNLDVMHLEKNVSDNFISTFLAICHKTKNNLNARLDLVKLGIREDLPVVDNEGK
jgi:hypothetical protein